jgi:hypothetical protein
MTSPKNLIINPLSIYDGYFYDNGALTLFHVDLLTGETNEISNGARGAGSIIESVNSMAIDFQNSIAYIITYNEIYSVNLISGNRTILASDSVGTGPSLDNLAGIQVSSTGDKLFVVNNKTDGELLEVSTTNGDRTILSNSVNGNKFSFFILFKY